MGQEWQYWVQCLDVMGRRVVGREVKGMVSMSAGRLIVMAPPGGSMVFMPEDLGTAKELSAAITVGVVELGDAQREQRDRRRER